MAGFITRDECMEIIDALDVALAALPLAASALRTTTRVTRNEHIKALKLYDRALEDHDDGARPEFRALGSLANGEVVQLESSTRVKRTSETGICISDMGRDTWINYAGKTSPVVVVHVEIER